MNRYIGIDVHQDKCHGTVLDEDGITARQGYFQNSPSGFKDFFDGTGTGKVAIEATDAWQPVYDVVSSSSSSRVVSRDFFRGFFLGIFF
ncbi:hypothetical protein AKJ62_04220 [candidate division MSBL1 archaeon SCGC-AAA259D14]|uniref:Uncharacterized protein n=1 Tax=candidate division MSBL1 archaeon SCGC-AAA259D14 TaxID=1698261 RepID=A0A133U3Y5_9EURY|nr:hypothetical protein AKJ62_04220 [candidate division MSBL1 archaeon SCGC-AAA259D14]